MFEHVARGAMGSHIGASVDTIFETIIDDGSTEVFEALLLDDAEEGFVRYDGDVHVVFVREEHSPLYQQGGSTEAASFVQSSNSN